MTYQERDNSAIYIGMEQVDPLPKLAISGVSIASNRVGQVDHADVVQKISEQKKLSPEIAAANTLIGCNVHNLQNEYLGNIKELMLNIHTGKIAYILLSFGDRFSIREQLIALPWSALTFDRAGKRFVLDIDKNRLKNAPGFDWKNGPDVSDESWIENICTDYKT